MSLLNQASSWENSTKRKRKSTINNVSDITEPYTNMSETLKEVKKEGEERNAAIHKLINDMDKAEDLEQEKVLEEFEPMPNPLINHRKDLESKKIFDPTYNQNKNSFAASQHQTNNMSNYSTIYQPPPLINKIEGFNNMNPQPQSEDLLMKKINYMINLLEEQQHEKTNNITEEFILYIFLGIFTIYIVDSFSRSGKYRR
tara:strand:- start:10 stop:609 length:600 start_codon:yes stop_codon:yes gene_type:complete